MTEPVHAASRRPRRSCGAGIEEVKKGTVVADADAI